MNGRRVSSLRRAINGRLHRAPESGFTLVELVMGITVLGIIMVPLGMAIALGFRATLQTHDKLAAAADAQAVSAYFPADVQSVDANGFNPTDSVNEDVCPADPTAVSEEVPLALFVWNQDLGVNGQTVARYIARGKGADSELVRRYCQTTTGAPVDSVLARNFGSGTTTPASDYFTDPGAVNPARNETPACGTRTCSLLIHGTFDFRLDANRRVEGQTSDATIPGKPTNVHTTGGNQRATIYWDNPVDDGGAPIQDYFIENVQTSVITGPYETPASNPLVGEPGQVGVVITGLTNGQGYTFRVRARNALGPGAFSDPSTSVTPGPTVPDPPTIGTATANALVAGQASATWSLPSGYNDGGTPLTGFRLYAQNQPNPAVSVDIAGGSATTGAITSLLDNTEYQLQVTALNSSGESSPSAYSNIVLTLPGKPSTPVGTTTGTIGTVKLTFAPPSGGDFADLTNVRAHIVETGVYTTPVSAATACPTGSAGNCQITVSGLTAGQTVKVQAQNATGWGTESDASTGIDVVAPIVTLTAPAANAVLGTATPTFSGVAGTLPGDQSTVTVNIYSGATTAGTLVQTRTATASGSSWTVNGSPALPDGQYTAQASQSDDFGNVGVSGTRTFWLDSTGPTVTITTPANNSSSTNLTPTFSGTAGTAAGPFPSADSTTVTVKVYSGSTATGSPVQTRTATRSGANWTIAASPALTTGVWTVQATQTDAAGNTGTATNTFGIDTSGPTVAITAPTANQATNDNTPTLTGTAGNSPLPNLDSATVTVKIYTGATTGGTLTQTLSATRSGTDWTINAAALANGQFTAQASQTDAAGNTGTSAAVTFVVDTTAPAVTLTAPANNTASTNLTPTFSGAAGNAAGPSPSADSATVTVKIYSGVGTGGTLVQTRNATRSGAAWTIAASPALTDGTYTAQATQTDAAGNTGASSANTFIIDTTGPTVVITAPADGSATNSLSPTFTGTAGTAVAPNADSATVTVKIYSGTGTGGTLVQTRAATRVGANWTIAASPALTVGTYTAQATQTDSLGNTGTSAANTFLIDTVAPTVAITAPTANLATNDNTPTFTGTAGNQGAPNTDSPTVTVKIYTGTTTGGTLTQTLPATRSGTSWTINATTLADGQYTAQASQTDAAGNTGLSTAVTFVVDTVAPTVVVTAPADNSATNNLSPTFTGTAGSAAGPSPSADSATVTVKVYSGATTGGTLVQTRAATRVGAAWTIAASPALTAGTYTVEATQTDAAGNTGTSLDNTFVIDTTAPSVAITDPTANEAINDAKPPFTGTAGNAVAPIADSATVTVKIYTGATTGGTLTQTLTATRSGTSWSVTPTTNLANGQFTAQATQTDSAGNTGTSTAVTFVVDTTVPVVTVTAPANGSASNNLTPTFTGTAGSAVGPSPSADSATVSVKVYAGATATGSPVQSLSATRSGAAWTVNASSSLATGTYTVQATQSDAAGNVGTSSANTFLLDTAAPTVVLTTPADNSATNDTTPTYSGTAGNQGAPNTDSATVTVKIYSGATTGGTLVQTRAATRTGTTWTIDGSPALAQGTYTAEATQTDAAGNTGTSNDTTFVIDTTAPTVTITAPAANLATSNTTPTISGTAGNQGAPNTDSATVTTKVYSGATTAGTLLQTLPTTRSGTSWSVTPTALANGQYTLQSTQTDAAGNTGTSAAITFVVDTIAPTVTLTAPTANQVILNDTAPVAVTFTGTAGSAAGPSPSADSATVNVTVYSGPNTSGSVVQTRAATRSGTAWTIAASPNLAYGQYTVKATQSDAAGNTGTSSVVTFQVAPRRVRVNTVANGGSSTGDGTAVAPLDTVTAGIAKAVSNGWTQVDIGPGTFDEGTTGVALVTGINISGGWNATFTTQTNPNTSTVIQGGQQAAFANGDTGITINRLTLAAVGASSIDKNVYGLRAIQNGATSSSVALTNVKVTAAAGFDGDPGTPGTAGVNGADGTAGGDGTTNTSNGAGTGSAGGSGGTVAAGGAGGNGGNASNNPTAGTGGTGAAGGGAGGTAGARGGSSGCQAGTAGGPGTAGTDNTTQGAGGTGGTGGVSGLTAGSPAATFVGSGGGTGTAGANGTSGGGGGGGGGSGSGCSGTARSGGGGGGGGGQGAKGGTAGTGGTYGGGSFGVYVYNSSVTLDSASSVTAGNGGAGGNGATGGSAATGGNGGIKGDRGNSNAGDGGKGGDGGDSAKGGTGGGGAGGPSIALFDRGTGSITPSTATLTIGSGGAGGSGGTTGGTGQAQNTAAV